MGLAGGKQFLGDEGGFDGLADADVVGDEQSHRVLTHGHEQWDELVAAGFDGQAREAAERPGAGAESDPQRVAQHACRGVVAEVGGGRCGKARRDDLFKGGEGCGEVIVGAAEWPKDDEVAGAVRLHNPFAVAGTDERPGRESRHESLPVWLVVRFPFWLGRGCESDTGRRR